MVLDTGQRKIQTADGISGNAEILIPISSSVIIIRIIAQEANTVCPKSSIYQFRGSSGGQFRGAALLAIN